MPMMGGILEATLGMNIPISHSHLDSHSFHNHEAHSNSPHGEHYYHDALLLVQCEHAQCVDRIIYVIVLLQHLV